jgi:large subunit ribosomal protein L24e
MVQCSFCGEELKEGEGLRLFKRDGSSYNFCSRKCEHNQVHLKRNPAKFKWTQKYASTAKKTKGTQAPAPASSTKQVAKAKKGNEVRKT